VNKASGLADPKGVVERGYDQDAVVSFYTLEHIPSAEHKTVLRRIGKRLRVGGLLLMSMEAGDYDDVMGEWLGVPVLISCYDPNTMKRMVNEAGSAAC
jgi:hypothetical protein